MNTPKRLLSGSDEPSEFATPTTRRRSRSSNDNFITPIDDQIEQVAKRHRVPSDTVKRIVSDLLTEPSVIDYLRTNLIQLGSTTTSHETSFFPESSLNKNTSLFSPNLLPTTAIVDEYDPLWLEFLQSLNPTESNHQTQVDSTQSMVTFDSLFNDDEDDEEFVGPDDENPVEQSDPKKLRVSKRELALLLKDSTAPPDEVASRPENEILPTDQYETLWTEFLASLQRDNTQSIDEQPKSIVTTTTDDDDNDDDPEFRLPETDYDVEDDLDDELHVSKRELALLLQDNASILDSNEPSIDPDSVSSSSTITHHLTSEQREILQYQLSAYVQLLTQYILLQRETDPLSSNCQSAQQLFRDLIFFRDQQTNSILRIPLLNEAQRLLESPVTSHRRKAFGNHLPFHLMDTFCKSPAFPYETLLPTCLLSSSSSSFNDNRSFVSGEDCLLALGLEQNDVKLLVIGHNDQMINDRVNSLRYVRVRRGKPNPIKAFFTYGSVPDASLVPWYRIPNGFNWKQIYPHGLIEKVNVVFPSWFRLSYKRSRQLSRRDQTSFSLSPSTIDSTESPSSSTVYVVVEGNSSSARSTSPKKVLQQIHMLHLLNSYPKLQPRQRPS